MIFLTVTEKDAEFLASGINFGFADCWTQKMTSDSLKAGTLSGLICVADGKKTGYITYCTAGDSADVETLFVFPEYRKNGIGYALVSEFLAKVKENGVGKVFLEVRKSNAAAISLYKKFGFTAVGERKKYYSDGEDALVFSKEI